MTLLSGTTVSIADGLLRLAFVTLYVAAAMTSLGAIGLAISTLTEHAIGAIAATAIIAVASEVIDNVPQFARRPPLSAHALVDVLRQSAADAHRDQRPAARAAVVLRVRGDLLRDRVGQVHQRRRDLLRAASARTTPPPGRDTVGWWRDRRPAQPDSLFDAAADEAAAAQAPLAVRMRPRGLDEVIGQRRLLGDGTPASQAGRERRPDVTAAVGTARARARPRSPTW